MILSCRNLFILQASKLRKFSSGPEGPRLQPLDAHWSNVFILGILEMTFLSQLEYALKCLLHSIPGPEKC